MIIFINVPWVVFLGCKWKAIGSERLVLKLRIENLVTPRGESEGRPTTISEFAMRIAESKLKNFRLEGA